MPPDQRLPSVSATDPVAGWQAVAGGLPLLRGRLRPPPARNALVARPRLDALLDRAGDYEVVLLSAPAGFGKTTAVSQWFGTRAASGRRCAWVSLDEMDSEPGRILMYLVASLSACDPGLAQRFAGLFETGFEASPQSITQALFSGLEDFGLEVTLVVDDLHASLEEESRAIFANLVNHGLPNLHLVLVLRDAVYLPLARARMRHALLEIGPLDLQFSSAEAESYFAAQPGLAVDEEDVRLLWERTDGWIAALQLAVLSLRGHRDPKAFIQQFSGENRDISDLLAEEVLASLPPEVVDFLEQSAVLTSFSAPLCDELFGRTDSRQVIHRLESGNFFIFTMDDERSFYRYHRLFAEHLRRNLAQRDPARILAIHRGAAEWFRDHALPVRACLHAARTGDAEFLAEILSAVTADLRELGYGGTVMRYAASLPSEIANRYPLMQLDRIYALTLSWRFDEARKVLEEVRRTLTAHEGIGDELYPKLLHREGQLALLTDQHSTAERLCVEWLGLAHQHTAFEEAVVRTSLICSRAERYEFGGLEASQDIRAAFSAPEMRWATVWHDSIIGACYFSRGDIDQAESLFRQALSTATSLGGRFSATPAMPGLHLAELLYERNLVDEAAQLVADYLPSVSEMGMIGQVAAGYVTRARVLRLAADHDAALKALDEGSAIAERRGFTRLHHILMHERYQLLLEAGQVERCFRIARADGLMSSLEELRQSRSLNSLWEPRALSWASINLARNHVAEAAELLEHWRKALIARGAVRAAMPFYAMALRAAIIRQDRPRAARLLAEMLQLARDRGFVRAILDAGPPVIELLRAGDTGDAELAAVRLRLLRAAGVGASSVPVSTAIDTPAEALNARETQIMRLVIQGLMNKQIAAELGLTVGTVKWYMQQIFAKLNVSRRAQAIHKAQQLGFLR
jgi:LuxR family maltose regulon positive regulatory protein